MAASKGRNRIHHQQRRMSGAVHRLTNSAYPTRDTGRRFIMNYRHHFDFVPLVCGQPRLNRTGIGAVAPITGKEIYLDP